MSVDNNRLFLSRKEIQKIILPELDYKNAKKVDKLPAEVEEDFERFFDSIAKNGTIDPNDLRNHLRAIG
jgi:hypothetical protein